VVYTLKHLFDGIGDFKIAWYTV